MSSNFIFCIKNGLMSLKVLSLFSLFYRDGEASCMCVCVHTHCAPGHRGRAVMV